MSCWGNMSSANDETIGAVLEAFISRSAKLDLEINEGNVNSKLTTCNSFRRSVGFINDKQQEQYKPKNINRWYLDGYKLENV